MKQTEKIFALMCFNRKKRWWYPPDFMRPDLGKFFVGYEASARLSELATKYPAMIETQKNQGKYALRRVRWETIDEWIEDLPTNLREIEERYR